MATYRKGFKKTTPEQRLLQVIVGIIITVFVIVAAAFIYDLAVGTRQYEDFTKLTKYEKILTQVDAEEVQLQDYVVYFYSNTCLACESVKNTSLRLANRINKDSEIVFFANTDEMTDTAAQKDLFLDSIFEPSLYTPTIVVIANGQFEEIVVGADEVVALLKLINAGTYAPFND